MRGLFSSVSFDAAIDNNPDDGKQGMWLVSGVRHSCVVNGVSTARDALNKAVASGNVGSWERCTLHQFRYDDERKGL